MHKDENPQKEAPTIRKGTLGGGRLHGGTAKNGFCAAGVLLFSDSFSTNLEGFLTSFILLPDLETIRYKKGVKFWQALYMYDEWTHLPMLARNIAKLYEAVAQGVTEGGEKKEWYPDLDYTLTKHQLIEEMYKMNGS